MDQNNANLAEVTDVVEASDVIVEGQAVEVEALQPTPWMSVIIPAYNCRVEIERLLDSIVRQNWSKDRLEVIICDDNSTDNFMELVTPYYEKLNIRYFKTKPRDIHCPGNTRIDGWSHATGEWVTFIDNDDQFDDGAFDMIYNHIQTTGESRMVFTYFHEYIPDEFVNKSVDPNAHGGYGREFDGNTWLHGNWYNRQWLIANNINFKEDLESHEDLYFNSLCTVALMRDGASATIPAPNQSPTNRQYAYTWIFRPNSLSRGYFSTEHYYIEVYLRDYIYSASEPWFRGLKDARAAIAVAMTPEAKAAAESAVEFFLTQCIATLLYSFFYWEGGFYRIGADRILPENINYIKDLLEQICFKFKITRSEIIARVYARPDNYQRIKAESFSGSGAFVEYHTFRDFILGL